MAIVKVKMSGSGTKQDPFTVNLPTFRVIEKDYQNKTMLIEIPDDEFSKKTRKPHHAKIRRKYRNQKWDRDTLEKEIEDMIVK